MKSLFLLSVLTIGSGVSAGYPRRVGTTCKAIPGGPGWPSDAEWAALNTAVKGRLLKPAPPAAPCHQASGLYNEDQCESLKRGFRDSTWHSNHPTSNMWQNYNNYSCMPGAGNTCSTDGYPVYVVAAEEASDVKAAVDFARNHNIRLNIKSTGHDFLGRSTQPYSLSIWTKKLNTRRWYTNSFSPTNCGIQIPGAAVKAGSGSQWGTLGNEAKQRDLMVVGGAFATVSMGGFISNGGHGALSAKYGLGADQVYEIELVTPMGEHIIANECQNTDYFWAMRGGGGSTYGVAIAYTVKAYPNMPFVRSGGTLEGWDEITYFHRHWSKLAMIGGGGYFNGYPGRGKGVRWSVAVPNATESQLRRILDPILEGMGKETRITRGKGKGTGDQPDSAYPQQNNGQPKYPGRQGRPTPEDEGSDDEDERKRAITKRWTHPRDRTYYKEFNSYYEATKGLSSRTETSVFSEQAGFPGMGQNKILSSWLWSHEDNQHPNLKQAIMGAFDSDTQMLNDATMGIGTHNPPYIRGGGNAVNPAFRTAVMRPASEQDWVSTDQRLLAKRNQDAYRFTESYRSIAPNGGTYANEAHAGTRDWQHAFWGSNYERLLQIKMKADPYGVLYCRACVGSEYFTDNNGQLCYEDAESQVVDLPQTLSPPAGSAPQPPVSAPEPVAAAPQPPVVAPQPPVVAPAPPAPAPQPPAPAPAPPAPVPQAASPDPAPQPPVIPQGPIVPQPPVIVTGPLPAPPAGQAPGPIPLPVVGQPPAGGVPSITFAPA